MTSMLVLLCVAMVVAALRSRALVHRVRSRPLTQRRSRRRRDATWLSGAIRRIEQRLWRDRHSRMQSRRGKAGEMAALLDDLARRCSSGDSLARAFASSQLVVAMSPLFDPATMALQGGATLAEALRHQPRDDPSSAIVVHVLMLCAQIGGNVSEPLDRAASTLRERDAAARERMVQSAQARLSAQVLTVLPLCFAAWSNLTSNQVRRFVLTPAGLITVASGLMLNLAGWRLMSRIVRGI